VLRQLVGVVMGGEVVVRVSTVSTRCPWTSVCVCVSAQQAMGA
jgi:hypothetical protein